MGPSVREEGKIKIEGLRMSFLLCQMAALDDCDLLVAIGGRIDGPASVILAVARERRKPILPFRFLGGAAERVFNQIEGELRQRLENDVEKLAHADDGANAFLSMIDRVQARKSTLRTAPLRVFLSYSWKRGEYADFVETILRRRENISVFRDESQIPAGGSITAAIQRELTEQCNVFLALWGREYVESPHCHDEMYQWHKLYGLDNLYLLRFDKTRPVWPLLRRSPTDLNEFVRKWPIVDVSERRPILEKELGEFIEGLKPRDARE
jgi:TIR domain